MTESKANTETPARPRWRPRFGMAGMLIVMLVCSVTAAPAYYLVRGMRDERDMQLVFIVLTLSAPVLLVVAISTLRSMLIWFDRRRRR